MPLSITGPEQESDYLKLNDGTEIPFIERDQMTIRQNAQWSRFTERLQLADRKFKKAKNDQQRIKATEMRFQINQEIVAFILPTLPKETLEGYTLPQLGKILSYWLRSSRDDDDEGN